MKRLVALVLCFLLIPIVFSMPLKTDARQSPYLVTIKTDKAFYESYTPLAKKELANEVLPKAKEAFKNIASDSQIRYEFDYLFLGFSATLSKSQVETLRAQSWVESVSLVGTLKPTALKSLADMIGATPIYSMKDPNGNDVNGKDIVVGVVDSGIDYRHSDLGGGQLGPNNKVIGGKNFLDSKLPPLDDDVMGHGTLVAGLIAAEGTKYQGIAPGAKLMSYRVFSNKRPEVAEDTVAMAIQQAAKDGCKVINVSLSSPGGKINELSAVGKAADAAAKSGIIVVGATGDYGSSTEVIGSSTVGGAGIAQDAIAVGAMDMRPGFRVKIQGDERMILAMASAPYVGFAKPDPVELVDGGYGLEEELSKLSLLNRYVLIKRGPEVGQPLPYFRKILNAKKRGAAGVVIWNHSPGEPVQMSVAYNSDTGEAIALADLIPSCFISNSDGIYLSKLLSNGEAQVAIVEEDCNTVTRMTAIGPTNDLVFKPDVCAPGIGLTTTLPLIPGNPSTALYTNSFSGTSASAAVVSGAAALVKQLHPDWSSSDVRLAFMNTSVPVFNTATSEPSSFLLQGAGRINVLNAANTPSIISPGGVIVKDEKSITLKFKGMGKEESYQVKFETYGKLGGFVKFNGPQSIKVPLKGDISYTFTLEFNRSELPWNAESCLWFESPSATLHVPVICWKDFTNSEKSKIKSFKLTGNAIDYGKTDNKVTIEFGIGMGDELSYSPFAYKLTADQLPPLAKENMLSGIQFDLVDGSGDTWATIKRFENVQYGYYSFDWDGKDAEGGLTIPDGSYGLKVVMTETAVEKGSSKQVLNRTNQLVKGAIKVQKSSYPTPPKFFMQVRPLVPSEKQMFVVDVLVTYAKDISSIEFELTFSKDEIEIIQMIPGRFLGFDGVHVEHDIILDDSLEKIRVYSKRSGAVGIDGHGTLLTFYARGPSASAPTIKFEKINPLNSKGLFIPYLSYPLELEITNQEPLLGDLNFDGIVDVEDWFIFAQTYGLKRDNVFFNPLADFNSDGIIDDSDMKVLLSNFGKSE